MTLWRQMQIWLAGSRTGRIALHLLCLCCDGRFQWHARGLLRELASLRNDLLTPHECLSRVGEMAGSGGNRTLCVHQNPPVLSVRAARFAQKIARLPSDSPLVARHNLRAALST